MISDSPRDAESASVDDDAPADDGVIADDPALAGAAHRGRLRERISPALAAAGHAGENAAAVRIAPGLSLADMAHAVALADSGSIDPATAALLAAGLLQLDAIAPADFPWDSRIGDPFNNREHVLTQTIGPAAAGWLSAGRPRREAMRLGLRLSARDAVLDLHDALVECAAAIAAQAARYADDLAADYTYLQPAQPATVGHLLLGYHAPVLRDARRLRDVADWLDLSVAGVGGTAGSRWPLDRTVLAELLGFSGLSPHTRDAMWATDGWLELLSMLAISANGQSQLGQDFEVYASGEFGFVTLSDAHSRESALMPQKKNPYALVVLRTHAGEVAGRLAGALAALHTGSARTDHFQLLNAAVPEALEAALRTTRLLTEVMAQLSIDTDRWADAARTGMVVAADIADELARGAQLDYRSAHLVVGQAVREVLDAGRALESLNSGDLQVAARTELGRELDLDDVDLAAALDPADCARTRTQVGSCAPEPMAELLAAADVEHAALRTWSSARRTRIATAHDVLRARVRNLASGAVGSTTSSAD